MTSSSLRKPTYVSYYWVIPTLAGLVWLGGLLALIGLWAANGTPRYDAESATIAFISSVGGVHKSLFISITVITSFFYIFAMILERWLRHADRIPNGGETKRHRREVIYDSLAIVFCVIGSAALILLSIFDTYSHPTFHWVCTAIFVLCIAISAVFQTLEILALRADHPDRAHLMRNAILKLVIVGSAIAIAIAFAVCYSRCRGDVNYNAPNALYCNRVTSAAAVCEWVIAFIFDAYLYTLALDLWPANKSSPRYLRRLERHEQKALEHMGVANPHHAGGHVGTVDQRHSTATAPNSILGPEMRQV